MKANQFAVMPIYNAADRVFAVRETSQRGQNVSLFHIASSGCTDFNYPAVKCFDNDVKRNPEAQYSKLHVSKTVKTLLKIKWSCGGGY